MGPEEFFSSSRVLIVAGKGGVGKTALGATCATAAVRLGFSTLLVEVGGRSAAAPMIGADSIGYDPIDVAVPGGGGRLAARSITPDEALVEWLGTNGLDRVARRMARSGLLEVVATATPGIKDLLVLGKIRNLEETGAADVIVVDAPAAGHALGFLRAPATIADTARAGTIRRQADEALAMLDDPARCRVMLVTIPEETPVNELVETAFAVEDEVGVALTPIVVNGVLPEPAGLAVDVAAAATSSEVTGLTTLAESVVADLRTATDFRSGRVAMQREQLAGLATRLPLEQIRLPYLFGTELGPSEIGVLADALIEGIADLPSIPAP